ncbi:hypothetical protein D3C81_2282440 [compost metagenome]
MFVGRMSALGGWGKASVVQQSFGAPGLKRLRRPVGKFPYVVNIKGGRASEFIQVMRNASGGDYQNVQST